jgi:hypothetical protein
MSYFCLILTIKWHVQAEIIGIKTGWILQKCYHCRHFVTYIINNNVCNLTWMHLHQVCGTALYSWGSDLHNLLGQWDHEAVYKLAHPQHSVPHTLHQIHTRHRGDTMAMTDLFQQVQSTENAKILVLWILTWSSIC